MLHVARPGVWGTAALVLSAYLSCAGPVRLSADARAQAGAESALREFQIQVSRYAALRRSLESTGARTTLTEARGLRFLSAHALAQEIRRARSDASAGDLFTPGVAEHFKRTIQAALRNEEMEHVRRMAGEPRAVELSVNQGYPVGVEGVALPACLGRIFPPLPEELEYQFVGRTLVLWDVRAAIVVDYLPGAIPELTE